MELRPDGTPTAVLARPLIRCAQCGDKIYMALWSEPVDARRIRHLWECDACGYTFETLACFPPE